MMQIFTLAAKDIKLMVRDKAGFFFTFIFPIIIAVLFGSVFSSGGGTRTFTVLAVDEDNTGPSAEFLETLNNASEINITKSERTGAEESVRKGKYVAFVALKKGFGEASEKVFFGGPPEIEIGVDPSRKAEAAMLQGILLKYGSERFQNAFSDSDKMHSSVSSAKKSLADDGSLSEPMRNNLDRLYTDLDRFFVKEKELNTEISDESSSSENLGMADVMKPLSINVTDVAREKTGPTNAYYVSFPQGILWGILSVAATFGLSIVIERTRGTMQRLRMAPVSLGHILAGKALACFISIIGVSIILLLLAYIVFKVVPASILMIAMAVTASAVAFTGIMVLLSVLGKTERAVGGVGWSVLLVMSMIGGGMVPLIFMPEWMQRIGAISPIKWAIISLEGALWRNFSLQEMLLPCNILVCTGVITFLLGVVVIRKRELA